MSAQQVPSDVAKAIEALTEFLKHGSASTDPQRFDERQLGIERDFIALRGGLRRGNEPLPGLMVDPELSDGKLNLGEPLPDKVTTVSGYDQFRDQLWTVNVIDATQNTDRAHLRHANISVKKDDKKIVRLRAYDEKENWILLGYPEFRPPSPVISAGT
jgi:hypothetical protein